MLHRSTIIEQQLYFYLYLGKKEVLILGALRHVAMYVISNINVCCFR